MSTTLAEELEQAVKCLRQKGRIRDLRAADDLEARLQRTRELGRRLELRDPLVVQWHEALTGPIPVQGTKEST